MIVDKGCFTEVQRSPDKWTAVWGYAGTRGSKDTTIMELIRPPKEQCNHGCGEPNSTNMDPLGTTNMQRSRGSTLLMIQCLLINLDAST